MKHCIPGLILCTALLTRPAWADIYVVTSVESAFQVGSTRDIRALFMGRSRTLGGGTDVVQPLDWPRKHELRNQFYKVLTGWTPAQVSSYWARLLFTGQVTPPLPLPNEMAVTEHLSKHPGAVGYLPRLPVDGKLKVLLVLRTDTEPDNDNRGP